MNAHVPLFTGRFFLMCGFTFTVFLSAFQLLPTAPYHILELGGSKFAAGLFLGLLTYSSAFSAPLTGGLADRVGKRRMLIVGSLAIAGFSTVYAFLHDYRILLALVLLHGVFWSGLLSASSAYITDIIPAHRRAEGISYWGLSNILAIAVAPQVGFAIYTRGWTSVCAATAALEPGHGRHRLEPAPRRAPGARRRASRAARGMARPDPVPHAVPLFVRIRRHHELRRPVRGSERRRPQEHLLHRLRR